MSRAATREGIAAPASGPLVTSEFERPSFDELYLEYRPILVRYARSRNAADAESVADLALLDGLRVLDRLRSYNPRVIRSYLFKATASHVARERRKQREDPVPIDEVDLDLSEPFDEAVATKLDLHALLDSLPPDQRDVIRYRFIDDLSAEETAERLGKTPGAVRMAQMRAIRRLRRTVFTSAVVITAAAIVIGALAIALRSVQGDRPTSAPADRTPEVTVEQSPPIETDEESGRLILVEPPVEANLPSGGADSLPSGEGVETVESGVVPSDDAPPTTIGSGVAVLPPQTLPLLADPGRLLAHDSFATGLGDPSAASSPAGTTGFAPGSMWSVADGVGEGVGDATVTYDPVGLVYRDAVGQSLATTPGGMSVEAQLGDNLVRRPYAAPELLAGGTYWVSFLIRADRPGIGDAFWTPDGYSDVGGAGIQQRDSYRFVNGNSTAATIEQGTAALIVVRVLADGATLWVNPNLNDLGPPDMVHGHPSSGPSGDLMFRFNPIADGAYTFDEIRIGTTARAVLPIG